MDICTRQEITPNLLPGRLIQTAVGKDGKIASTAMTMGFSHFTQAFGIAAPHKHGEEILIVMSALNAAIITGATEETIKDRVALVPGMVLHIHEGEWHAFDVGEHGHIDFIFIYSQTEDLRPETMPEVRKQV